MIDFFIRKFIKDYENVENNNVREKYGVVASTITIIFNVILFLIKLSIGIIINSVSIMADSFNNLSDSFSSIVSLIGFKMANKPADKEHPFGHGRVEYISGFIIAFIIILMGFELLKISFSKIFNPNEITATYFSIFILAITIVIKLWLSYFNNKLGKLINSLPLEATAKDSLYDVVITFFTIVSIIIKLLFNINIDGYIGVFVSIFLIVGGINIAKETLSPLIGEAVPEKLAKNIKDMVKNYDGIVGVHDLIIHNYGSNKSMATIHAEVPNNVDIEISHKIIDEIEEEVFEKTGVLLVIHMDPIAINDERLIKIIEITNNKIIEIDENLDAHDFRIIYSKSIINIIFELEIPFDYNNKKISNVRKILKDEIKLIDKKYNVVINVETGYIY